MTGKITIDRNKQTYFDDVVSFLCSFVSLGLTAELFVTGIARPFSPLHSVNLDAKQSQKQLIFYPHSMLSSIFSLQWPSSIEFGETPVSIDGQAALSLGAFEIPLTSFAGSMFTGYYERHKPHIESIFGKNPYEWPTAWNFGRVIRNAIAHGGTVKFNNLDAPAVSWKGLTYSPSNNKRRIMNTDIWPADLIYLMMDLDTEVA